MDGAMERINREAALRGSGVLDRAGSKAIGAPVAGSALGLLIEEARVPTRA